MARFERMTAESVRSFATVATNADRGCRLLTPAGPVCNPPCSHTHQTMRPQGGKMSVSAAEIPDKTFLQTVGDRRSIRYYDPDKKVEDWKIQTILQTGPPRLLPGEHQRDRGDRRRARQL